MIEMTAGFTLTRHLEATPEQAWNAWTDPAQIAQWWHPEGATTPEDSVEVDTRVGGRYRYAMVNSQDGTRVETGGVYREIDPPSRLSFTWGEPDADPDQAPLLTLTFTPEGEGTLLILELRGVDGHPGDEFFYDGWVSTLDSLAAHLR